MNFKLVESSYIDFDSIHDEFSRDYLESTLSNEEIRRKYDMTHREFKDCGEIVKSENGLSRRPFWRYRNGSVKYYYSMDNGFIIQKKIDGKEVYIGFVPFEWVAQKIVEMCINVSWDIDQCKSFCKEWKSLVI